MALLAMTGTNTDVGKTIATAALTAYLRSRGVQVVPIKPVQTGEPEGSGDVATVRRLSGVSGVELYRYPEPLAPHLSARRAGMEQASVAAIAEQIRSLDAPDKLLIVEGAGGLLVRLNEQESFADLVSELHAPLVIVTSLGLGSLNLAELSVEAARHRGIEVVGLIGGMLPQNPDLATRLNVEEMAQLCGAPLWCCLPPNMGALDREAFTAAACSLPWQHVPVWLSS